MLAAYTCHEHKRPQRWPPRASPLSLCRICTVGTSRAVCVCVCYPRRRGSYLNATDRWPCATVPMPLIVRSHPRMSFVCLLSARCVGVTFSLLSIFCHGFSLVALSESSCPSAGHQRAPCALLKTGIDHRPASFPSSHSTTHPTPQSRRSPPHPALL